MKKVIRLTESDLTKIVKRVIREQSGDKVYTTYGDFEDKDKWYDEKSMLKPGSEIEYDEEKIFGPDEYDDFMDYINNCDNNWCTKTKHYYNSYINSPSTTKGRHQFRVRKKFGE